MKLHGVRQDKPPKIVEITCELIVDTDESDLRLDLPARERPQVRHDLEHGCRGYNARRADQTPLREPLASAHMKTEQRTSLGSRFILVRHR
jgi:hypothetical protein